MPLYISLPFPVLLCNILPSMPCEKVFPCTYPGCPYKFKKIYDFNRHGLTHLSKEEKDKRKKPCDFPGCDFKSLATGNITSHKRTVHNIHPEPNASRPRKRTQTERTEKKDSSAFDAPIDLTAGSANNVLMPLACTPSPSSPAVEGYHPSPPAPFASYPHPLAHAMPPNHTGIPPPLTYDYTSHLNCSAASPAQQQLPTFSTALCAALSSDPFLLALYPEYASVGGINGPGSTFEFQAPLPRSASHPIPTPTPALLDTTAYWNPSPSSSHPHPHLIPNLGGYPIPNPNPPSPLPDLPLPLPPPAAVHDHDHPLSGHVSGAGADFDVFLHFQDAATEWLEAAMLNVDSGIGSMG
ncbi:hypothetical protein R3P38DRAFT_3095049 [Favolaschia claudopus]|uniref:C2H2-type domain-containing protein n=1 Tax=Favolaschia claudopus TaxID=2862362 RepID=A0AAV9ZR93_9AGAR